jgi:hypothetical protein
MSKFIFDNTDIFDEYFINECVKEEFIKKNKFILDDNSVYTLLKNHRDSYKEIGLIYKDRVEEIFNKEEYKNDYIVMHNVYVNNNGVIYSSKNIYVNGGCQCNANELKITTDGLRNYEEDIISITGKWSTGIWHFPFESLSALKSIPEEILFASKIHVGSLSKYIVEWCETIGIKKEQLITGNIIGKKIYFPRMGMCGNPYYSQIRWIQDIISSHIDSDYRTVILIKRNGKRAINNYIDLENEIKKFSVSRGLQLYIHDDSKLPCLKEQHEIFSKAKYVFAPHGAGGIHLPALKRDSWYIEFLNDYEINMCYSRLAYFLDVSYYGLTISKNNVNIERLKEIYKYLD